VQFDPDEMLADLKSLRAEGFTDIRYIPKEGRRGARSSSPRRDRWPTGSSA
jgi:hypothetical protein